ncbi:LMBR1-like conserved region-containing protein [Cavenderia fasciculata]|uniref:LMBR1-like conserved region-containing protein n=1 Tax=Cavenderia fasciculata TaxID=261658 RepID=F4PUU1_CACFS|nr:LMBR1-like conserved region-containing protein [Cavenderia fasciculata]EGG21903.1 LMBR1-like conserved region-containing protein [Cavenderia fasciculata]|eukprot:XP_004359754.1 LMBR1-like conserved region-containing protein [Cavenderia fasciculata]
MVNVFLIIVAIVVVALIILASLYLIVYFQHPDDKNVAWLPKIIVVAGLTLAAVSILMLPLDVANKGGEGGFPMDTIWLVIYIAIAIFSVIIVPFAMFYYESEEADGTNNQFASAFKGTLFLLFAFAVITVLLWLFIGIAEIPTVLVNQQFYVANLNTADFSETGKWFKFKNITYEGTLEGYQGWVKVNISKEKDNNNETRDTGQYLVFRVSIFLFIITMVSFFGWLMFIIFGGIGLAALPFDMITDFGNRPQRISYDKYLEIKAKIGERATQLVTIGKEIQTKYSGGGVFNMSRKERRNYNRYRAAVFELEDDYEKLKISYQRQGGKVIFYWAQFFGGFIAAGCSVAWVLHDIIYMWTQPEPFHPFLNNLVISLDNAWGFLGTICYGLLSFYLLFCCVKGNFKFGLRIFFLFPVHPMRVGATMMNAFLFNVGLILICCVSITQFCTMAFSQYTSVTAINSLFSNAVRYIKGLKWFWVIYIIAIFVMSILALIMLFVFKSKDKKKKNQPFKLA